MSTETIIATFKEKAMKRFEKDLDALVGELAAAIEQNVQAEQTAIISKHLLPRRKKIATTDEALAEHGMSLEEAKLHNAEADGFNTSRRVLRKKLLGTAEEDTEPVPEPTPEPAVVPAVEPEVPVVPVEAEPMPAG